MESHCKPNQERREPSTVNCVDHSGILMWMKGIAALIVFAITLLSYSVFSQAPELGRSIAKIEERINSLDKRVSSLEKAVFDKE